MKTGSLPWYVVEDFRPGTTQWISTDTYRTLIKYASKDEWTLIRIWQTDDGLRWLVQWRLK